MKNKSVTLLACLVFFASSLILAAASDNSASKKSPQNNTNSATVGGVPTAERTPQTDRTSAEKTKKDSPLVPVGAPDQETSLKDIAKQQILLFSLALIIFFPMIWMILIRTRKPSVVGTNSSLSQAELKSISDAVVAVVVSRTTQTDTNIRFSEANIKRAMSDMGPQLVAAVSKAAAQEVNKTQLGELNAKCKDLEEKLSRADRDLESERENTRAAQARCDAAVNQKNQSDLKESAAIREKLAVENTLNTKIAQINLLTDQLASANKDAELKKAELEANLIMLENLRSEANKPFEVLAPVKLKATELGAQMQAIYQAAVTGDVAAIAAWSTLTTFASAQADPAAKDFQLQIVRRLGVALVGYWKHQSLSEKERHEKLSQWAKSLNEHADSRFNLLVPGLGEPIDKTRMTCATTSTAIREVLCWQVRNPSGASFSLAEVA